MSVTLSECVSVALVIQHAMCMHHISSVACPALQYFSTFSHKGHDFRKKKAVTELKCVSIFSSPMVRNISHSKKKRARYDQKCILVFT